MFLSNYAKEIAIDDYIDEHLSEEEMNQYRYIKENQPISRADFAKKFSLTTTPSKTQLNKMIDLGLIRRIGVSVNTKYECVI